MQVTTGKKVVQKKPKLYQRDVSGNDVRSFLWLLIAPINFILLKGKSDILAQLADAPRMIKNMYGNLKKGGKVHPVPSGNRKSSLKPIGWEPKTRRDPEKVIRFKMKVNVTAGKTNNKLSRQYLVCWAPLPTRRPQKERLHKAQGFLPIF